MVKKMNVVEMMHIVIMAFLAMMAGAEMKRKTNVVFVYEDLLDKVYNLFTQTNRKSTKVEVDKNQYTTLDDRPTWKEMTDHHGYMKILMGLVLLWRRGGRKEITVMMTDIPEYVLDWMDENATLMDRFLVEKLQELVDYMESGATQFHREGW
tara:strand:- start:2845 stop:3300 length:456 start_codon:yes stop_codon:yes gene_type:complete